MTNVQEVEMIKTELPAGDRALGYALELIRNRFEEGSDEDRLAYHNREHTQGVFRRASKIADTLGLPLRERTLVEIGAAFHDTVQMWEPNVLVNGTVIRKRKVGVNERESGEEAVQWMKAQKDEEYTDDECELVRSAITVTIPSWSVEHGTVNQAELTPDSHPVIRTIALADIGSSGIEPDVFREEGNSLFIEQELDIIEAIRNAKSLDDVNDGDQELYLARYRAWINSQSGFARGRQALLEAELGNLDDTIKERMRQLFSQFDNSIKIAEENAKNAEGYSFAQMSRRLVSSAFPSEI